MLHVAILRKVRDGREAEFEAMIAGFFREAAGAPGVSGAYLLRPGAGAGPREYGILRSFASEDDMRAFYDSALFRRWEEAVRPLVEGEAPRRNLHGLEAFFAQLDAPPRWKMAMLTWIAVTPAVYVFSELIPTVIGAQPKFLELLVVNVFVVAALSWVLMPALARVFDGWLRRS